MASGVDRAYEVRLAFGHPTQDEKGRSGLSGVQEVKEAMGVALHPALVAIPIGILDDGFKAGDVIVILHVNCHGVNYGARCGQRSMHGYIHGDSMMSSKTAPR